MEARDESENWEDRGRNNQFVEASGKFDPALVDAVLQGAILGCIFRGLIQPHICAKYFSKFSNHPSIKVRQDADALHLGAYQFDRDLETYLHEIRQSKDAILEFFDSGEDPTHELNRQLADHLQGRGACLRAAMHDGLEANPFVLRSWAWPGQFSLSPHEDEAQCHDPRQAGFEVQRVAGRPLVTVNVCLHNERGGALHVWARRPTRSGRKAFGTEALGYPYPLDLIGEQPDTTVSIEVGDVYFFDARHIHAVGDLMGGRRATASYFLGTLPNETVLYWT